MKNIKNMMVVGGLCLSIACSAVFTLSPMTVYAINTIEYETEYMEPIEESDYLVNQNSRNIFKKNTFFYRGRCTNDTSLFKKSR